MKTSKFDGKVESAYGNPLAAAVSFSGDFQEFESKAEVEAANELPDDKEIVQWANAKRKAAARAKATTAALTAAGIEPPAKDDPKVLTRDFLRNVMTAGKSESEARELAKMVLGDKYFAG